MQFGASRFSRLSLSLSFCCSLSLSLSRSLARSLITRASSQQTAFVKRPWERTRRGLDMKHDGA